MDELINPIKEITIRKEPLFYSDLQTRIGNRIQTRPK